MNPCPSLSRWHANAEILKRKTIFLSPIIIVQQSNNPLDISFFEQFDASSQAKKPHQFSPFFLPSPADKLVEKIYSFPQFFTGF
jgi:hypothetical protein